MISVPTLLQAGPRVLLAMAANGELQIGAARVGRFYGDGLVWALSLPLHELMAWSRMMAAVATAERGR